jgi:hypothetical protein
MMFSPSIVWFCFGISLDRADGHNTARQVLSADQLLNFCAYSVFSRLPRSADLTNSY